MKKLTEIIGSASKWVFVPAAILIGTAATCKSMYNGLNEEWPCSELTNGSGYYTKTHDLLDESGEVHHTYTDYYTCVDGKVESRESVDGYVEPGDIR